MTENDKIECVKEWFRWHGDAKDYYPDEPNVAFTEGFRRGIEYQKRENERMRNGKN